MVQAGAGGCYYIEHHVNVCMLRSKTERYDSGIIVEALIIVIEQPPLDSRTALTPHFRKHMDVRLVGQAGYLQRF